MPLDIRRVDVAPDPLALAESLAHRPGLAVLWSSSDGGASYVACDPIALSLDIDPEPALGAAPEAEELAGVPRWIGLLPYECRRSLERPGFGRLVEDRPEPHVVSPIWLRYGAVARVTSRVEVIGDEPQCIADLARLLHGPRLPEAAARFSRPAPIDGDEAHVWRIERALELIAAGELYQVNLSRRWRMDVAMRPLTLLRRMSRRAPSRFGALVDVTHAHPNVALVATSPELFLDADPSGRLVTSPIKGTRPRGADAAADAELRRELDLDPKERAELTMVLDVERNDLGRVAVTGSVQLVEPPHVRTYGTVHHRVATLAATLRRGVSRSELLRVMLPSGSVTGAPKVRAMEVIAELESQRRGLYTGAYGALSHAGGLQLAMAIRCLTIQGGEAHYDAGGGIVADSDPLREVEETRWKALQLTELVSEAERAA